MDLHNVNRSPQRIDPERRAKHRAARKVRAWKTPLGKRALRSSLGLSIQTHCLKFGIERLLEPSKHKLWNVKSKSFHYQQSNYL